MSKNYLIMVSEDPFEATAARRAAEMALQLRQTGNAVTLFLVQNGVLASRASPTPNMFAPLISASVEVVADEFSMRERGIEVSELREGMTMAPIDLIVQRLAAGWHTLWS
jgi:sulfur relay (sulfurtransferase) complex TusBCD TusD component (DsrE family)